MNQRAQELQLDALDGPASDLARARCLFGAAHVAEARRDVERTRTLFEQAAELLCALGETRWLVLALTHLAWTFEDVDPARVEQIQHQAIALAEENGDLRGAAIAKGNLASHRMKVGDVDGAVRLKHEALAMLRAQGDVYGIAASLCDLAEYALVAGDVDAAARHIAEAAKLSHSIGDKLSLAQELYVAAATALAGEDADTATRLLAASERMSREGGFETGASDFPRLGMSQGAHGRD